MESNQTGGSPDESDLNPAIQARLDSLDAGNYRANNELVLTQFATFLEEERGICRVLSS